MHEETALGELKKKCIEKGLKFIENPYPLQNNEDEMRQLNNAAIIGSGVTSIDVLSFFGALTERDKGQLRKIFPVSRNGVFSYARATNQKSIDKNNFHNGYVFTKEFVDLLRIYKQNSTGTDKLDFELDLLPVLVSEMVLKYYSTLLGKEFEIFGLDILRKNTTTFLLNVGKWQTANDGMDHISGNILSRAREILMIIDKGFSDIRAKRLKNEIKSFAKVALNDFDLEGDIISILKKLESAKKDGSNFNSALEFLFDWEKIKNPLNLDTYKNLENYKIDLIAFMQKDIERALQGNVLNPYKAACDSVWRDLRDTIIYAVQKGGLTPSSYEKFLDIYLPLHNRICDGPGVESIKQIVDLIKKNIINLDFCFNTRFEMDTKNSQLLMKGPFGQMKVTSIILGTLDVYKNSYHNNPLYNQMIESGLIRPWKPFDQYPKSFGIDLDDDFHPYDRDNIVNKDFTFLGPACEGFHIFQHTLARPDKEQAAITNLKSWLVDLETQFEFSNKVVENL